MFYFIYHCLDQPSLLMSQKLWAHYTALNSSPQFVSRPLRPLYPLLSCYFASFGPYIPIFIYPLSSIYLCCFCFAFIFQTSHLSMSMPAFVLVSHCTWHNVLPDWHIYHSFSCFFFLISQIISHYILFLSACISPYSLLIHLFMDTYTAVGSHTAMTRGV